jgi:hypothetical protein
MLFDNYLIFKMFVAKRVKSVKKLRHLAVPWGVAWLIRSLMPLYAEPGAFAPVD